MLLKMNGSGVDSFTVITRPFVSRMALLSLSLILIASQTFAAGSWTKQRAGTLSGWAVYFLDQQRGWIVGTNGIVLATADGGESWKPLRRPTEDNVRDLYFSDEQKGWIVCERSLYLLKTKDEQRSYLMSTIDGGKTWRRVNMTGDPDARLLRVLFTTEGHGWVFGEGGMIYVTGDGGQTWLKNAPRRATYCSAEPRSTRPPVAVGTGATIIQTRDGGETWRNGNVLGITSEVRFTATSFVDKVRGWAVGNEGRIFMTVDGGRTWSAQKSNVEEDLNDVKFIDTTEGWAAGNGGVLLHTTDGGFHWTVEQTGTTHPLERLFFVSRERGWAVGFGGTILSYAHSKSPALKQPPALKGAGLNK